MMGLTWVHAKAIAFVIACVLVILATQIAGGK